MRRIAIFGTFDVENYGDLLFPLVAQRCLAASRIEIVPVSPTSDKVCYGDVMRPISLDDFARDPAQFDGVLIGGGNIVHVRDFQLPTYESIAYPSLWIGATAHAVRHGLPVMWNAPGVLAPRDPGPVPDWLARVVRAADHFAVRDAPSAHAMAQWSGRRPDILPDTVLDLAHLWPHDALQARFRELRATLGVNDGPPVIALHVKRRSLGALSVAEFSEGLSQALEAAGAVAILLALGRCHDDHHLVREIHAAAGGRTIPFEDAEALQDIAAVIAGSSAYIGASLHGHITAAAYGTPSRVVAVPALHKFLGQARLMDRADELVADWPAALADLSTVIAAPRRPLPQDIGTALQAHWATVAGLTRQGQPATHRATIFDDDNIKTALRAVVQEANMPPQPTASRAADIQR